MTGGRAAAPEQRRTTYCRICEPNCGLVATVQGDRLLQLRPDKEHPLTRGFACPKGIAMTAVQNDPDRLERPLRRRADGSGFDEISWTTAIAEIGVRLRGIRDRHGQGAIGGYMGNPAAFSSSHMLWFKGFMDALGTRHFYSASSQDTSSRFVASQALYGSPLAVPVPDLAHTDLLLVIGANPWVSHGSLISGGDVRRELTGIAERGGRVVIVDPRRTETARRFEHLAVLPGGDPWLLLSLLQVILSEELEDRVALARASTGAARLRELVAPFSPERTAERSGIDAGAVRELARALARAPRAAVYGRVGACTGPHGTLVNLLLDTLNVVTGNFDARGGALFPEAPIDTYGPARKAGLDTYDTYRSRIGDYPEVLGTLPAAVLPDEITTPGPGRLRALVVSSGNPILSCPGGGRLRAALEDLELLVSLDLYLTETNRLADYVLPTTTFLERDDLILNMLPYQLQPFLQWTDAVVPPRGECREEWEILRDLAAELDLVPVSSRALRRLGRVGRRLTPRLLVDLLLRTGPVGDRFGLRRGGWSVAKLRRRPHGVVLGEGMPTGMRGRRVAHPGGLVDIASPALERGLVRLRETATDPAYPLRLFGRRELRSINSWMHNVEKLQPRLEEPELLVHPGDLAALGARSGERVMLRSSAGALSVAVRASEDVRRGAVCMPHGFGHGTGGWQRANALGGPNVNALIATGPGSAEPLSGMTVTNGVPVRLERLAAGGSGALA
ncbi:molybdopterin-dependent oxidoreductase [Patulibacter brassicae]|jgi:formate dehydrogenase|uniref:Molybdopterin-dependent oxidoreductase n=1 Tax=Patulibacter brassicae TaxID=1705717 RepID=A0ABU4VJE9_9ACTN|nr:molybdopterin-dependent oxidoreductase [Patulibacter brassicae]MDX8151814.1 molybdopterin-dependent oxidoreductase [Patulibacter brassicae]